MTLKRRGGAEGTERSRRLRALELWTTGQDRSHETIPHETSTQRAHTLRRAHAHAASWKTHAAGCFFRSLSCLEPRSCSQGLGQASGPASVPASSELLMQNPATHRYWSIIGLVNNHRNAKNAPDPNHRDHSSVIDLPHPKRICSAPRAPDA